MICAPVREGPHVRALPPLRLSLLLLTRMMRSTGRPVSSPLQRDLSWRAMHLSMHALHWESCSQVSSVDRHTSCWHKHVGRRALPGGSAPSYGRPPPSPRA